MSGSVILLMCPFLTFLSQICSGLLPMLYKMDRNPDWNVFLNIFGPGYSRNFQHRFLSSVFIALPEFTGLLLTQLGENQQAGIVLGLSFTCCSQPCLVPYSHTNHTLPQTAAFQFFPIFACFSHVYMFWNVARLKAWAPISNYNLILPFSFFELCAVVTSTFKDNDDIDQTYSHS